MGCVLPLKHCEGPKWFNYGWKTGNETTKSKNMNTLGLGNTSVPFTVLLAKQCYSSYSSSD